jgi:hypothetical protein
MTPGAAWAGWLAGPPGGIIMGDGQPYVCVLETVASVCVVC